MAVIILRPSTGEWSWGWSPPHAGNRRTATHTATGPTYAQATTPNSLATVRQSNRCALPSGAGDTATQRQALTHSTACHIRRQGGCASLIEGAKADPCLTRVDPSLPKQGYVFIEKTGSQTVFANK